MSRRLGRLILVLACVACGETRLPSDLPDEDPEPTGDYVATDLGSIDGALMNSAVALDDFGLVAGTSGDRAFTWRNGVMRELSGREDGYTSAAALIGPNGQVAGYTMSEGYKYAVYWDAAGVRHPLGAFTGGDYPWMQIVAFGPQGIVVNAAAMNGIHNDYVSTWYRGVGAPVVLGNLRGHNSTYAAAINSSGKIVGNAYHHYADDDRIYHPVVWEDGTLTDLGTWGFIPCSLDPERDCSSASAIGVNDRDEVIVTDGSQSYVGREGNRRYLDDVAPGDVVRARFINNQGQVAGETWVHGSSGATLRAFRVNTGGSVEFMKGADGDVILAMNERGDIIGTARNAAAGGRSEAFIWRGGVVTFLGVGPLGGPSSTPHAVNARGDVVGTSGNRAILWRKP